MVLPLALMLGGAGLQSFGQDQRSSAQDVARLKYGFAQGFNSEGGSADQNLTNQILGNLGQQSFQSNEQAVEDLSADNLRGAFGAGSGELEQSIQALVASTPQAAGDQMAQAGQNTAFTNAQQRQKMSNDRRTEGLNQVLENNAGMDDVNETIGKGFGDKADRDQMIQGRIRDILRLQNYADAVRSSALQKAGAEHGLDQARAASVGSGAMYLGALMGAGGVAAGSMTPGQPAMGAGQGAMAGAGAGGMNAQNYLNSPQYPG